MAEVMESVEVELIQLRRRVREYVRLVRNESGDLPFLERSKLKGEMLAELERLSRE